MHADLIKEPSPLTADTPVLACSDGQGTAEPSIVLKAADGVLPSAVICEGVVLVWTGHKGTVQHMGVGCCGQVWLSAANGAVTAGKGAGAGCCGVWYVSWWILPIANHEAAAPSGVKPPSTQDVPQLPNCPARILASRVVPASDRMLIF